MHTFPKIFCKERIYTIRNKLTAIVTVLLGLISIFISCYFPLRQEHQAAQAITNKAQSIAKMTAFSLSPALFLDDIGTINEIFSAVKQNKGIEYIIVINDSGQVFAEHNINKANLVNYKKIENKNRLLNEIQIYKTKTPIKMDIQIIGELFIGLSLRKFKNDITQTKRTIILVSIIIFVIGMVSVFSISTILTNPLKNIVETVEKIANGDLKQRTSITSNDETGLLGKSFNIMVNNLQTAYYDLENINLTLEKRVEDRTRELLSEINERKQAELALQKAHDELEDRVKERTLKLEQLAEKLQDEIKERKKAEEALRMSYFELKKSNKELEDFTYVVSHDLKEPLRKISSFGEFLMEDFSSQLDNKAIDYILKMQSGTERMKNLINDLLIISRVERMKEKIVIVKTNAILAEVLNSINFIEKKKTNNHYEYIENEDSNKKIIIKNLPNVMAASIHLQQLFQNLISNALKFQKVDQNISIYIDAKEWEDWVTFSIKDNGIGIEKKYLDKIFLIFQRLYSHDVYEGTGVGLALCKKIIEQYGGTIWCESEVNKGSSFYFTFKKSNQFGL